MEILSYIVSAMPFLIAFLAALALCALAVLISNSVTVAMGTMVAVFLLEAASMSPLAIKLGLWIYPPDLLIILLLPALFYRLVLLKKFASIPRAWWVLGMVWLGLFVWGLVQFGTSAGVDCRPFLYIWLGAAYLSTFEYDEAFARSMMKFFIMMGVGVCAIAYYRWTMGAIDDDFHRELQQFDATGVALPRVMSAGQAFILMSALLVVVYQAVTERMRPMTWLLTGIFVITLVALQHRSVWMAACGGFVALTLALRQLRAGAGSKLFSMVMAVVVLLMLIALSGRFQGAVDSVEDQASRATSTTSGTFVGRVVGWQDLLNTWVSSGSPVTYLVGKPFGGGYERYAADTGSAKVGYMPHNFYVQMLYRGGVIGLLSFLWMVIQSLRLLWIKLNSKNDAIAPLLFAMLVAQLIYYIPYGIDYGQMILFGLLLGVISKNSSLVKSFNSKSIAVTTPNFLSKH
jgi:uncharacterized membrane protein